MAEETQSETATQEAAPAPQAAQAVPAQFKALLGEKVEMTQIFTSDGQRKAVTVVRAGPCPVVRVKTPDSKDGYAAAVLAFGARAKGASKPLEGQFRAAGLAPARHVREVRGLSLQGVSAGQVAALEGRFAPGDFVDVHGVSKGKGFAGVMKRHNFRGLPASHGASDKERSPGSLTSRRSLGRVLKGQRMAGHLGHEAVTLQKVEVVQVDAARNLLYLGGCVPGPKGALVLVRETVKRLKRRPAAVAKATVKKDKMGNIIAAGGKAPKKK